MLRLSELSQLIEEQFMDIESKAHSSIARRIEHQLMKPVEGFARIISGIRRCGKSTLLYRLIILSDNPQNALYINFDTPKLYAFTIADFDLLDQLLKKNASVNHLYFDEIQLIDGWEVYIRKKLDEGYFVTITGSNAHMLSKELGTRLTGRHLTYQLYPFSYGEYLQLSQKKSHKEHFKEYMLHGGFPSYIQNANYTPILSTLVDDILHRDIAVRYGIREVQSLKNLIHWLASNTSQLMTASKLKHVIGVNSLSTVTEYLHYLSESYLIQLLNRFSWKEKNVIRSPRKSYLIDPALIQAISIQSKPNWGQRLELVVHNALKQKRMKGFGISYWQETNVAECDFVLRPPKLESGSQHTKVFQVCYELNSNNESREFEGIYHAMCQFDVNEAQIITFDQEDIIKYKGKRIDIARAWQHDLFIGMLE